MNNGYNCKPDHLYDLDNFLEIDNLLKPNQEEIQHMNKPVTWGDGLCNQKSPNKVQDKMASLVNLLNI
jgi:hypothetical protein